LSNLSANLTFEGFQLTYTQQISSATVREFTAS